MTYNRVLSEFYGLGLTESEAAEVSSRFSGCVHYWAYLKMCAGDPPLVRFCQENFLRHYFGLMKLISQLDFSNACDPSLRGFHVSSAWENAMVMPSEDMFDDLRPDFRVPPGREHPELDVYIAGKMLSREEWAIGLEMFRPRLAA